MSINEEYLSCFESFFKNILGNVPFLWQKRLLEWLNNGEIGDAPVQCNIPTGLGKTAIIPIWLWAYLTQDERSNIPRRLVYVVDRRTIVDQATDEAVNLLQKWDVLKQSEFGHLLLKKPVVSTLRGQYADNHFWLKDPTQPAIIVGTIDMIGSRLLFSGYGNLGKYSRSLQAGLLGQDTLFVVDEAHLCPAFVETLIAVQKQIQRYPSFKPFRVILLSATQTATRKELSIHSKVFSLLPKELDELEVAKRVTAKKNLRFICCKPEQIKEEQAFANKMADEAVSLAQNANAVVVFVNTVRMAEIVFESLNKSKSIPEEQISVLTGEKRGYERDNWIKSGIPALFQKEHTMPDRRSLSHPIFMIATAAGEVGINFDADHAVCDLVSLERMIQRLGRVNRFGYADSQIRVVLDSQGMEALNQANEWLSGIGDEIINITGDERSAQKKQLSAVLYVLQKLPNVKGSFSAAPANFLELFCKLARHPILNLAFTKAPICPPLDESKLDDWSLTTLSNKDYPRSQVGYWLRGLTPDESLSVRLAWRKDLNYAISQKDAIAMVNEMPLRQAETAQISPFRVNDFLGKLLKQYPKDEHFLVILDTSSELNSLCIADLPEKSEDRFRFISNATIILPTCVGGLSDGLLAPNNPKEATDVYDLSFQKNSPDFQRILVEPNVNGWVASMLLENKAIGYSNSISESIDGYLTELKLDYKFLFCSGVSEEDEDLFKRFPQKNDSPHILYFARSSSLDMSDIDNGTSLRSEVTLEDHSQITYDTICGIVKNLNLDPNVADSIIKACRFHDLGKKRLAWQKAVHNFNTAQILAKSGTKKQFNNNYTQGYRHEFGSIREIQTNPDLKQACNDLILHLIAAHHGYARPGFEPRSYQILPLQKQCENEAHEVEMRFARLQRMFGWWQLAYLESLVKCADALASEKAE